MDKLLGILNTANNIVKAGKTAVDFAVNPLASISQGVAKNILTGQTPVNGPAASTKAGIAVNTIVGLPRATAIVAKDIGQGIAREAVGTGMATANVINLKRGADITTEYTPSSKFGQAVLGTKNNGPVKDLASQYADIENRVKESKLFGDAFEKINITLGKTNFNPLLLPAFAGIVALDFTPFGGARKKATQSIVDVLPKAFIEFGAKTTDPTLLQKAYQSIGVKDVSLLNDLIKNTVKTNTPETFKKAFIDTIQKFKPSNKFTEANTLLQRVENEVGDQRIKNAASSARLFLGQSDSPQVAQSMIDDFSQYLSKQPRDVTGRYDVKVKPITEYKNPEDYIKSQGKTVYHQTSQKFNEFDTDKSVDGSIWFTDTLDDITSTKRSTGASSRGNIMERIVPKDLKLATPEQFDAKFTDQLISEGYDGVYYPGDETTGAFYQIFKPEKLKNKSSLLSEWNKVNGKKLPPSESFGAIGGFEEDEDGKLTFDPMKAAFGVAGMTAFNKGKGFMKKGVVSGDPRKTLANVEKRVGVKKANRAEYDSGHFNKKPVQLTPELEQKAIGIEIAKESIANNPLNQLIKYASKRGDNAGKLPEVLGGKDTSGFRKRGDDIITETLGRDVDSETTRADFEKFMAQKKTVQEAEIALKQEIKALKYSREGKTMGIRKDLLKGQAKPVSPLQSVAQTSKVLDYVGSPGELRSLEMLAEQSARAEIRDPQLRSYASLPKIIAKLPTPVKVKVNILDYIRTPENVLKKIGLSKQMDVIRRGYDGYLKELPKNLDKITEWSKQVPKESSSRIFKYLDGQAIDLSQQEVKVAGEIKVWLMEWADRLGLPQDNRIANYITHLFDDQLIKKEFDEDLAKIIAEKIPSSVYDQFLLKRLGAKGYKEDVWTALDAYVKRGTRKVHMDPALEVLEESARGLEESQWNYVKRFADRVNMRPTEIDNMIDNGIKAMFGYRMGQRPVTTITGSLRRATYRGMLGLNVGSALRNLSQGINTYAKLGEKYTTIGYSKLFSPANLAELKVENVLSQQFVQDRSISAIKTAMQKIDKGLFLFFETAERINRGAAYFGAKAKGLANGMNEKQAVEYGKKIVRETQFTFGSIDTPVGMSSDIVKTLTQFQTFTTKQIEFLAGMAKNKEYAGLIRYALAGAAFVYTVGQAFGMDIKDLAPVYRFGIPPSLKFPYEVVGGIVDAPDKYGKDRAVSKKASDIMATLPGYIPGGIQIKKTTQGIQSIMEGGSYDKGGNLQFEQGTSGAQKLQSILFGKYAGQNAQEYSDKSSKTISDIKKSISADLKTGKIDVSVAKQRYIGEVKELATQEKKTRSTMSIDTYKKDLARAIEEKVITVADAKEEYIEYTDKIQNEEKRALAMKTEYPDKDIKTLVKVYAKALGTDPVNAFKALLTKEKIDKVEGSAVLLQRMRGAHYLNSGGSEEYMKERLSAMNIPWSKREDYNLEHVVPVSAGGSNADDNLQIISRGTHDGYTVWDTKAGNAVRAGRMSRGEVADIAKRLKIDRSISVEEAISALI